MPPPVPDIRAQLSVLDRLLDDEPRNKEEAPLTRAQSVRLMKAALRRDLEWLLNTRSTSEEISEEQEELRSSVYAYGLPDFTALTAGSEQAKLRLRRAIEHAVGTFEPRLIDITVTAMATEEERDRRVVRFLISGLLRMEPAPEPVTFDTLLELSRGEYKVRGD